MSELVPQAVRDLLAFYSERHPEVRFGDVDVTFLQNAIESIGDSANAVLAAQEAVTKARADFAVAEGELVQKASRVLSFLNLFVEGDTEQKAELEAIAQAMPGAARRKTKSTKDSTETGEPRKRRTRTRKPTEESIAADQALEAAIEKAGLGGDLTGEWDDASADANADVAAEEPAPRKTAAAVS
jgi:hypothetical protein